jgi:hypothetical protein
MYFSIQNIISVFTLSLEAILKLATSIPLLYNQKILLIILKSYFDLKNIDIIFRAGPYISQYDTRFIVLIPELIWLKF